MTVAEEVQVASMISTLAQTFKLSQAAINKVMNDIKYHTLDDTTKTLLPQLHYHMEDVKCKDSPEVLIKQKTPKTENLVKKEEDDSEDDI
ncbi:hypothetical protein FQN51_002117 [Onygenales sp. PD_10]|nr:hypothetical protein FQN51_002117 [Onygenales sp. PD_10]